MQTKQKTFYCTKCKGIGYIKEPNGLNIVECIFCDGKGFYEEIEGVKFFFKENFLIGKPKTKKFWRISLLTLEILGWFLSSILIFWGLLLLIPRIDGILSFVLNGKESLNWWKEVFIINNNNGLPTGDSRIPLWLGNLIFLVLFYHRFVYQKPEKIIFNNPYFAFLFQENFLLEKQNTEVNVAKAFSPKLKQVIEKTLDLAYQKKEPQALLHLLEILIQEKEVQEIFYKLEIDQKDFFQKTKNLILEKKSRELNYQEENKEKIKTSLEKDELYCFVSYDFQLLILEAFWEAVKSEDTTVRSVHLLSVIINHLEIQPVLNQYSIQVDDFLNVIVWVNYKRKLNRKFSILNTIFQKPNHRIMNRSWSAIMTKFLDQFSLDLTSYAKSKKLLPIVNREKEMRMLVRILQRQSKNNALLIGEKGSGKGSLVRGLAIKVIKNEVPSKLFDKRVVQLDLSLLSIGSSDGVAVLKARLENILKEVLRTKNIILYIPNIHELGKIESYSSLDIISFLTPIFSNSYVQIIGSTTQEDYQNYLERRTDFAQTFDIIKIAELSIEDSLKALSYQISMIEKTSQVSITYRAVEEAVKKSKQFIFDRLLPQKAYDLLSEAAVRARNTKGINIVSEREVLEVLTEKTGVPVTKINNLEAENLLNIEVELAKIVIGQKEAVKKIASAIKRMRVRIGESERPIAVFMFLGPTGVGKTELAKALAKVYFGSRDKMIRLDMSEYATPYDIERLIGDSAGRVKGIFTEKVKNMPFSLILLDEFEKAHPSIWDLFLQVFDDGVISDGKGKLINFENTILIATSNVGSKIILEALNRGMEIKEIQDYLQKELLKIFRPEFLNRFDDIITFQALSLKNIQGIVQLEIKSLNERLEEMQGIKVNLTEDALKYLAEIGYSPQFGARFLKKKIREKVEDAIVTGILQKRYQPGSEVILDEKDLAENKQ